MRRRPPLLLERPWAARFVLVLLIPALYGALTGYLLGVSKGAYTILGLVGIIGVLGAGFEHDGARSGALRGLIAGAVFGAAVLIAHEIHGVSAKATLPKPHVLLIVIAAVVSAVFGALGGWLRGRVERRELAGATPPAAAEAPPTAPRPPAAPSQAAPGPAVGLAPSTSTPPSRAATADGQVSLNSGSFEDFRALGMSVTQAKRVIAYREQLNGYSTVEDLDQVPGFSQAFRAELKSRLSA